MIKKDFGVAGNKVVIEELLRGEESSFLAFTDGETVVPMPSSQDHKAIYDGDQGLNTGGMGAYSPAPVVTPAVADEVMRTVMVPTVRAMSAAGRPPRGGGGRPGWPGPPRACGGGGAAPPRAASPSPRAPPGAAPGGPCRSPAS